MFEITAKSRGRGLLALVFCILGVLGPPFCSGAEPVKDSNGPSAVWDPGRYIGLDEIKPGMEGYCLTEYGVKGIEKFNLKVIDVVRDFEPGRDVILVEGTDERFIHTGPVGGCSGSPVYLDGGRMAGALAFAWTYSKDPLYGVTAIEDMLRISEGKARKPAPVFGFDYSQPIDLAAIDKQISSPVFSGRGRSGGATALPCPLITYGLPVEASEQLSKSVEPLGMMVVPGLGLGSASVSEVAEGANEGGDQKKELVPGACLVVPLVSGDIAMAVYGTVTEVRGEKVYGFGHPYLGYGDIDLPMATGRVHTVVSSLVRSSKLARVVETVGALTNDEGAGILGTIGATAQTFPVTVRIERFNDIARVYNCRVASNRLLTSSLLRSVISGACLYLGDLPPDHTVEYSGAIRVRGFEPIIFDNTSAGSGIALVAAEAASSAALLMNNPYEEVAFDSMEFDIRIVPKDITSHVWSADLSDVKVKAGEQIGLDVVVESVRTQKKKYRFDLEIPKELAPGKYELTVCGSRDYEQFLLKTVPHRFVGQSLPDLIEALRDTLLVKRDRLYCYLVLPSGGIILEKAELPDLPATKMLVLQSPARPMRSQLYPHWIEKTVDTGTIVINKRTMHVVVEK